MILDLFFNCYFKVTSWQLLFKSLKEGKQTKKTRLENLVVNCRGSLAWLGRQTHNLENGKIQMRNLETKGAIRLLPEVAGSNPVPGTTFRIFACMHFWFGLFCRVLAVNFISIGESLYNGLNDGNSNSF